VIVGISLMYFVIIYTLAWRKTHDLESELGSASTERDGLQRRFEELDKVGVQHVWKRADALGLNRFTEPSSRRTRFIAVCNLKGGVGKTTVTMNIGTFLALMGRRVLLVHLDFQGTMSNLLIRPELLQEY